MGKILSQSSMTDIACITPVKANASTTVTSAFTCVDSNGYNALATAAANVNPTSSKLYSWNAADDYACTLVAVTKCRNATNGLATDLIDTLK